jgi:hypothetical protein
MTLVAVLQKATEGGYRLNGSDSMDTDEAGANSACSAWTRNDNDSTCVAGVKEPWLDPHFWRALGLALGWHEGVATKCLVSNQWRRQPWHRFSDHLADGHTPEAFFQHLTSSEGESLCRAMSMAEQLYKLCCSRDTYHVRTYHSLVLS